jgi:hypothetical protein
MKIVQSLVSMTLGAAILVLAANQFAPGWAAELRSLVQRGQEWSEQAIRSDPVGFLETTRDRLMDERNRLDELVRELRASMGPLDGHIEQLASELAKTEAFLREGRTLFQQVSLNAPAEGIRFAGRRYPDAATFKTQLELLFGEKTTNQRLLDQAQATRARLNEQLYGMLLQAGKLDTAIAEIDPQIAIVRAERSVAVVERTIAAGRRISAGVLDETSRLLDEFPVGTTRDLLRTLPRTAPPLSSDNPTFAAFLKEID